MSQAQLKINSPFAVARSSAASLFAHGGLVAASCAAPAAARWLGHGHMPLFEVNAAAMVALGVAQGALLIVQTLRAPRGVAMRSGGAGFWAPLNSALACAWLIPIASDGGASMAQLLCKSLAPALGG